MASIDGVVTALNIEEGEIPKDSDVMIEIQELSGYSSATYYMPYTTIDKLFNLGVC